MKIKIFFATIVLCTVWVANLLAQDMPLVYDVENTGIDCPIPYLPSFGELSSIPSLPDPFEWADNRGRIKNYSDWRIRRAEIGAQIQNYEIGTKPVRPDSITASYSGNTLTVNVTVNGQTLTLTSQIILPAGTGPFPAVIGMNSPSGGIPSSIFSSRNIAQITYSHNQVTTYSNPQNSNPYYRLYPNLNIDNTGQYSAWSWGISRLIDGLELVQDILPIDLRHIAVTGCSYAGKMALFAGAFDERIALTISQESGGGGYTTWRYSQEINKTESVETLGKTDYNWFKNSMRDFSSAVDKLPEDHHELMAMVAPRALLVTGNPGWVWLADESGYVGSKAAKEVWNVLGIPDRFGFSQIGGHEHCAVPNEQMSEIEAFVEKFLIGNDTVNTDISTSPYSTNLSPWITWTNPILSNNTTYYTSLIYPMNLEAGLDTNITFRWKKINEAEKYYIEVSTNKSFTSIIKSDSTLSDTLITFSGLLKNQTYYWRVMVRSSSDLGPWSNVSSFITTLSSPAAPQIISAVSEKMGYITLKWKKIESADNYLGQVAKDKSFTSIFKSVSTSDTVKIVTWFSEDIKYYWRIKASNIAGLSSWSEVGNFTLLYAPTNLSAQISALNEITLTWNDNSTKEIGNIIERKLGAQDSFLVIDTLIGSGTEYIDQNVEQGEIYTYRIKAYKDSLKSEYSNEASLTLTGIKEEQGIPTEFSLSQNYPNPFNPLTTINYSIPQKSFITIKVYNLLGEEVRTLFEGVKQIGNYTITFNSEELTSGVYLYQLKTDNYLETKKLLLLK